MSISTAIVWFRRDLRLHDNPALSAAIATCDQVIPVYIHAPEEEAPWSPGGASNWWLNHSLQRLSDSIERLNGNLVVAKGGSQATLERLIKIYKVTHVYWNRLYEPSVTRRDSSIKKSLKEHGIKCASFNASLLTEPWQILTAQATPYKVFSAYWRTARPELRNAQIPLPVISELSNTHDAETLLVEDLGLRPAVNWYGGLEQTWTPGEEGALRNLDRFLDEALRGYDKHRDFPAKAGTSRLSPHLHFGEISPRQILWPLVELADQSAGVEKDLERFVAELGWREFAHYVLYHFPETQTQPLDRRFESMDWRDDDTVDERLERWKKGQTGIPIIDAGMRELWHTGWMHNRVRMIVASLLTKNLGVHWLVGARWFWDTLVDANLANNTMGWQWTAGCGVDAAPYFRVFNPILQAARFDPDGSYIRKWVPELAGRDDKTVFNGVFSNPQSMGYPVPMVDIKQSRAQALSRWEMIKNSA